MRNVAQAFADIVRSEWPSRQFESNLDTQTLNSLSLQSLAGL
jgi:hypothetical protein